MSAHTPGPWAFNVDTNTVEDADGVPVCSMPTLEAESSYEQTILADAGLIRAAPELLAALKRIVAEVDRPQTGTPVVGGVLRAIAESRDVIAKAEAQ